MGDSPGKEHKHKHKRRDDGAQDIESHRHKKKHKSDEKEKSGGHRSKKHKDRHGHDKDASAKGITTVDDDEEGDVWVEKTMGEDGERVLLFLGVHVTGPHLSLPF